MIVKHYLDIPYSVTIELGANKNYAEIALYAIASRNPETRAPISWLDESTNKFVPFEKAAKVISEAVQQDIVMNYNTMGVDPRLYSYFSTADSFNEFSKALHRSYQLASELLKK